MQRDRIEWGGLSGSGDPLQAWTPALQLTNQILDFRLFVLGGVTPQRLLQLPQRLGLVALLRQRHAQVKPVCRVFRLLVHQPLEDVHGVVAHVLLQVNPAQRVGHLGQVRQRLLGALRIGKGLIEIPGVALRDQKGQVVQGHAILRVQLDGLLVSLLGLRFPAGGREAQRQFDAHRRIDRQRFSGFVENCIESFKSPFWRNAIPIRK